MICAVGDLAFIIGGTWPENLGCPVRVEQYLGDLPQGAEITAPNGDLWRMIHGGPVWWVRSEGRPLQFTTARIAVHSGVTIGTFPSAQPCMPINDQHLRPIPSCPFAEETEQLEEISA